MDKKTYYRNLSKISLIVWALLALGFLVKTAFEPADWLFKSAYNPLLVFMVYSLISVFAFGYFAKKSNNSFKTAEIHILRNGEIHKHKVWDLGFFEWYSGKKEILEKATLEENNLCGNERPPRKVFCQLLKNHEGSHRAVIFWEDHPNK